MTDIRRGWEVPIRRSGKAGMRPYFKAEFGARLGKRWKALHCLWLCSREGRFSVLFEFISVA